MRRRTLISLVAAFCVASGFCVHAALTAQVYARSYALVIGIDQYPSPKWRDLQYAVKDAMGMADLPMIGVLLLLKLENLNMKARDPWPIGCEFLDHNRVIE